jgi:chloride channel 7
MWQGHAVGRTFLNMGSCDVQNKYEAYELMPMLLVGIIGGLLGSLFNHLNEKITRWRKQNIIHTRHKLWDVAAVAVFSATISFILPLTVACKVRAFVICSSLCRD